MAKRFGIREISEMTGYSIATVSRVLNKTGKYSPAAEEKILAVAKENNYEPDIQAKGLRGMKSKNIGVIIPDLKSDFIMVIALKVQNALVLKGYFPIFLNIGNEGISPEEGYAILRSVNVAGLISVSNVLDTGFLERLGAPIVYINRDFTGIQFSCPIRYASIQPIFSQAGLLAAELLYWKGCRSVSFLPANRRNALSTLKKQRAFSENAIRLGMEVVEADPFFDVSESEAGYLSVKRLFEKRKVDGLFCATDWINLGALTYFREAGIRVPEEVQTIGFGKISELPNLYWKMTSIRFPVQEMAAEAADMIIALAENENTKPKDIGLPVSLFEGETTRQY